MLIFSPSGTNVFLIMPTKRISWLSFKPEWLHLHIDETETAALSLIQAFLRGQRCTASKMCLKLPTWSSWCKCRLIFHGCSPRLCYLLYEPVRLCTINNPGNKSTQYTSKYVKL